MSRCNVCEDKGFVIYHKGAGKRQIDYIAKCTCQRGNVWSYEGDDFRIPCIADIQVETSGSSP